MINKVVSRRSDGILIKGTTGDFSPDKDVFHVHAREHGNYDVHTVKLNDLKAVFFVNTLEGNKLNPHKSPKKSKSREREPIGKAIKVFFYDGEIMKGKSHSFHLDKLGFFMTPSDEGSNNERVFVVLKSVEKITFDDQTIYFPLAGTGVKFCGVCGNKMENGWKYCPFDGTAIA
jgi:hypothetical protein